MDFDFPWVRFLGMQVLAMEDGMCEARLDPTDVHLNHNGTVNAPILFGAAEFAGGAAATTGLLDLLPDTYIVAKEASIQYLAPARGHVIATGRCPDVPAARELVAAGQPADLVSTVELVDSTGRLAGRVTLTMSIRPRR